jgi:hypothetical protein
MTCPAAPGSWFFETPLATYVNGEGRELEIAAVSWGPWDGPAGQWDHGGIWLTFFSHPTPLFPGRRSPVVCGLEKVALAHFP